MRYRTIVADPPWAYDEGFASMKGREGSRERAAGASRATGTVVVKPLPYPSMSVADIEALPVENLAEVDANLFLWTTNRYLPHAFSVVSSWGFKYRQTVVWAKPPGSRPPFRATIAPNCAEFILVCRRGKGAPLGPAWDTNVVEVKRQGFAHRGPLDHSQKPEVFLDLIESVSPGPYLEMFSRRARLGWQTWGNEALHGTEAVA